MSKKIILFFVLVFFFSSFNFVRAEVVINEIMYAPTSGSNYEWVEIFNSGMVPVDLQGWRFFHGETNSGPLTLRNGSTTILQPSAYAIIAKSPSVVTDYSWLNFSGMILSASTLSLPDGIDNTYIAIASDTNKTISNSIIYDTSLGGSKDSGNSLSKINNVWIGATSTPGIINETATPPTTPLVDDSSDSGGNSSPVSSGGVSEPKTKVIEIPKIKTQIIAKTLGLVGLPVSLDATTLGLDGELLGYGKYFWNFGDGDSRETQLSKSGEFKHTYFYPGDYVVSLDYFSNPYIYKNIPDASSQIIIKVISADISISRVGDEKDFFVELSNNTDYGVDLSNWFLTSAGKSFTIPRNTILTAKKKMIISSKITNFSIIDKDTLKLMNSEGEVVFDYSASVTSTPKSSARVVLAETTPSAPHPDPLLSKERGQAEISVQNLEASVLQSEVSNNDNADNSSFPIIPLASVVFIGASASAVYFIRRKKVVPKDADDFEILDE